MAAVLRYLLGLFIGIFWSTFVILRTLLRYLRDPSRGWGVKIQKERPSSLESTENWRHNLVTLQHDGIKLHYVSAGSLQKPVMILLHGFPELWYSWRHQIQYFKQNYRVVALSMRGYGDSDAPREVARYKIATLVEDVKGLVRSLGVDKAVLVGHDWGGLVAWSAALAAPELFSKLIILNCPNLPAFQCAIRSSFKQFLMSWYIFFFQLPYLPEYLTTRCDLLMYMDMWRKLGLDHEEEQVFRYFYSQPGALTGPINYYRALLRYAPAKVDTSKIKLPTLLIWGTNDLALSEQLAHMSAEYCDDIRIKKIVGGNHFIQQDRPDEVNKLMDEFLKV